MDAWTLIDETYSGRDLLGGFLLGVSRVVTSEFSYMY